MGIPIGFQFILDNRIEILLSVIVIGVAAYFFLKGNTSSPSNECSGRSITHPTFRQQQRSKTTGHNEQMVMDTQAVDECALGDTTLAMEKVGSAELNVSVLQHTIIHEETSQPLLTTLKEEAHLTTKNQQLMDITNHSSILTLEHQPSIHEQPKPMSRDNTVAFENLVTVSHDRGKSNELSTHHKKSRQHVSSFNQTTSTPSTKKRNKRHTKTDNPTTDHQPHPDGKPKQDLTRYEQIGQQRQLYVALYKSRCEFWPKCTNNHCKYYHPFTECRNGNACKFGNKCVFLHPRDYLDLKQADETKKKRKAKNKQKSKRTNAKLQGNQAKPVE